MLVLAQKMRQKGNERCADEMLISLGERWIDIIGTFFVFESKNTKSNTKKFKEFKAFLEALKESMRFRLLHNILLEEYKVLSNAMMEVHCFPKRCEQFKTTSKIIADGLVAVNNSHDEFSKQIETDCTKN